MPGAWAHDHRPDEGLMVNNRAKRVRRQTTTMVDGQAVLKVNNYRCAPTLLRPSLLPLLPPSR